MAKVLITVPDLTLPGGVSNIYRSLKWDACDGVTYFYNTSATIWAKLWFIPVMLIRFVRDIRNVQLVQLNPSLDRKAVVRDGTLLLLSKLLNKQVIVFFHGWDENVEKTIANNSVFKRMFLLAFSKADGFFLLGSTFKDKLFNLGIRNENVFYLPTVADDSNLLEPVISKSELKTLIFISRFVPLKGIDIVLDAFHYLQENCRQVEFELIMAGDGPELNRAIRKAEELKLKNVTFTGHVEGLQKHYYYSKADFLFFPSHSEGLPCVIMEAMLYGLVIVTRPIGAIPDWVKHNVNGWLSVSLKPEVFAEGIISLAKNPGKMSQIKETNQATAKEKFTPQKVKEEFQHAFNRVLNECSVE